VKIAFVGFGSLGKDVLAFLQERKESISEVYLFDDFADTNSTTIAVTTAYEFSEYAQIDLDREAIYFVGLGYRHFALKQEIINVLSREGKELLSLIHDRAYVSESAQIIGGALIYPLANIGAHCLVADGVVVHQSASIAHDTTIGACSYISPGVVSCGNVQIGRHVFIGANATIADGVTVGDRCVIAAQTFVQNDLPPDTHVVGNPAQIVERIDL